MGASRSFAEMLGNFPTRPRLSVTLDLPVTGKNYMTYAGCIEPFSLAETGAMVSYWFIAFLTCVFPIVIAC